MSQQISLKEAEKKAFRTTYNDGLWDILLGCFLLIFVIAPFLSSRMGDFWSSAIFVPFWWSVYVVVRLIRKRVVRPRIGAATFGRARRTKLMKFSIVMLVMNIAALTLGILTAVNLGKISGPATSIMFGLILLVALSIAAYFLDFSRLYVYGLLIGISPVIGEWLFKHGNASHHGFPVTFGTTAGIMFLVGLVMFMRMLRNNPLPIEGFPSEEA